MEYKDKLMWEECRGIVSLERLNYVQSQLSIKLPESYLQIIKGCDGGIPLSTDFEYFDEYFKNRISGSISSFIPINTSQYGDMLTENQSPPEFFPENLIAFANTGCGDYICFDYSTDKNTPAIVYWSHGADIGKDVSFVANNFEEFISLLKEPSDQF